MELLDGGLDVIAVAGQAADEGGQAEGVELGPGQVDGFLKHLLADVVAYVVGVAHPSRRLAATLSWRHARAAANIKSPQKTAWGRLPRGPRCR